MTEKATKSVCRLWQHYQPDRTQNPLSATLWSNQTDPNRPTTKHFSNDIFARNYILITRRTSKKSPVKVCRVLRNAALGYQRSFDFNTYKAICFFVRFWKLTVKMHFRLSHLSQKVETAAGTVGSRAVIAPAGPTFFPGSIRA